MNDIKMKRQRREPPLFLPIPSDLTWLSPWEPVGNSGDKFVIELRREVGPGHLLCDVPVKAIARHTGCDDVLFATDDSEKPLVVVHLTWASRTESDASWPWTTVFKNWQDWIERAMIPDNRGQSDEPGETAMNDIPDLENRLKAARGRLQRAIAALAPKHNGGEQEEYREANKEVLSLERQLGAAKGEEYAVPIDFPARWDVGAPLPCLFRNDYRAFLTFYLYELDPNWDGSYVKVVDPGDGTEASLAVVEFTGCLSAKLGWPNEDVQGNPPLVSRGVEGYTAQKVENSRWLAELKAMGGARSPPYPDHWRDLAHFVFWFHDSTFECIARSYSLELVRGSMADLAVDVCGRLLK